MKKYLPMNRWPVFRQIKKKDLFGLGQTAYSERTEKFVARTTKADKVVHSICPYCGVGCGQLIYVKDNKIINIEGDPDSPISRGRLCPKGAATFQLVSGTHRVKHVLYRKPYGTEWEKIPLEKAMDMVAERVKKTRDENWEQENKQGQPLRRTLGIAHLGGATLDNEENYLLKKIIYRLGGCPGRKPGANMTLIHCPRSGGFIWKRRRYNISTRFAKFRLHCN